VKKILFAGHRFDKWRRQAKHLALVLVGRGAVELRFVAGEGDQSDDADIIEACFGQRRVDGLGLGFDADDRAVALVAIVQPVDLVGFDAPVPVLDLDGPHATLVDEQQVVLFGCVACRVVVVGE